MAAGLAVVFAGGVLWLARSRRGRRSALPAARSPPASYPFIIPDLLKLARRRRRSCPALWRTCTGPRAALSTPSPAEHQQVQKRRNDLPLDQLQAGRGRASSMTFCGSTRSVGGGPGPPPSVVKFDDADAAAAA